MLYQQLSRIRGQLALKELSVADGLLLSLRALRGRIADDKLTWLNRELLGYRPEDLQNLGEKEPKKAGISRIVMLWAPARKPELEAPTYRFLNGTWGHIDENGRLTAVHDDQLTEKSIFCNIGLQQLEAQLAELGELDEMGQNNHPDGSLFSMSFDPRSRAEFYCYSRELVRIQETVRSKLCQFIDDSMAELNLAPKSD